MPPRGTSSAGISKPSSTNASGTLPKSDQRRARNRLAQQAIRERKNAHIVHLEQQLALAQQGDADSRIQALLEENANLRKAFLTIRKKLLSLSTTSSLLADSLLPFMSTEQALPNRLPDELCSPHSQSEGSSPIDVTTREDQGITTDIDGGLCEPITGPIDSYPVVHTSPDFNPVRHMPLSSDILNANVTEVANGMVSSEVRTGSKFFPSYLGPGNLYFPLGMPLNMSTPSNMAFRKTSKLSDHIDFMRYIVRSHGLADSFSKSPPRVLYSMLHEYLEQCWPVMGPWFEVTNTSHLMCAVLWWQITNTAEAASQLPRVYTPTAIQLSVPHPSILDWVPHSTLRDQFILNQESFDLDEVICDLAAAYVVEVEGGDYSPAPKKTLNLLDAVQGSLRSGLPLLSDTGAEEIEQNIYPGGKAPCTHPRPPAAANIHEFKVDSSFFAKYPALYDPSAVANGMANTPIAMGSVQFPVPFSNQSAQAYIMTARRFITT